jgi:hypothetical protein
MSTDDPLYSDHTVTVDGTGITIHRYTFPLARDKHLDFDDIVTLSVLPTSRWSRWRLWGSSNLHNWFPLDNTRTKASHLVEIDLGGRIRPSFTPRDPEAVAELIRSKLTS